MFEVCVRPYVAFKLWTGHTCVNSASGEWAPVIWFDIQGLCKLHWVPQQEPHPWLLSQGFNTVAVSGYDNACL